jgi:hypothetical protein
MKSVYYAVFRREFYYQNTHRLFKAYLKELRSRGPHIMVLLAVKEPTKNCGGYNE